MKRSTSLAAISTLIAVVMSISGCAAEPEPTACPLPPLPPTEATTEGADTTVPAGSVDPRCNGGDLSPTEAAKLMADSSTEVTVLDTRTPAEYDSGHIPGAMNLSTQDAAFWDQVGLLPADGVYILYCRTGSTTRRVVEQMLAMAFGSVCHIKSGFNGWKAGGFPVERTE